MVVLLLTHIDAQTSTEGRRQETWPLLTSLLTQTHGLMSQQPTDLVDRKKVFGSSSGSENSQRKKNPPFSINHFSLIFFQYII